MHAHTQTASSSDTNPSSVAAPCPPPSPSPPSRTSLSTCSTSAPGYWTTRSAECSSKTRTHNTGRSWKTSGEGPDRVWGRRGHLFPLGNCMPPLRKFSLTVCPPLQNPFQSGFPDFSSSMVHDRCVLQLLESPSDPTPSPAPLPTPDPISQPSPPPSPSQDGSDDINMPLSLDTPNSLGSGEGEVKKNTTEKR